MKKLLTFLILGIVLLNLNAQEAVKIYNPNADARTELNEAIKQTSQSGKHVFLQIGGNWCPWCLKFHRFVHSNPELDSLLNKNYVICLINYSKENKNLSLLADLGYPQRFGFPVFVILDSKGQRLHTQDSGLLESGDGYDAKKVKGFLQKWGPEALRPENYQH
ncbi:MAG: thioredoxin family protein [Bacteroidales bacterium]